MKKKKQIIIACTVVIAIIIISLILALVYKGKTGKLPFEQKEEIKIVKMIENDSLKVTLSDVATAENYIIIEYDVDLKNNQADEYSDYINGLEYSLERIVKLDGKKISQNDEDTQQIAYKVSDNQVKIYDVIETNKIADTYKLEVDIYDTNLLLVDNDDEEQDTLEYDNTTDESEDILDLEEDETDEIEDTEDMEDMEDNYEEVTIDSEEYFASQEGTDDNETEELVTPYADVSIEDMDEDELDINDDDEKVGTLRVELKKSDTDQKVKVKTKNEETTQDDITTKVSKIIETDTAKIVIVDTEQKNVTEEIFEEEMKTPENFEINVQDENGNTIDTCKRTSEKIYNEDGAEWNGNTGEGTELKNGTVKIQTIVGLVEENKNITNLKIQPLFCQYASEEFEEELDNKTWYHIENGTYSNKNEEDGTIKITKIEKKDNLVKFYFNKKGLIPSSDATIIMRSTLNDEKQYIVPDKIYKVENDEYVAEFIIKAEEYEDTIISNPEEAEFSILENRPLQIIGKGITMEL